MKKNAITAKKAPQALGAYSHGVLVDQTLYVSGQLGLNQEGELAVGLENQVRQALENLKEILKEADMKADNIVKTTLFIKNMDDFTKINAIYAEFFKDLTVFPARSCVEVAALPKDALFEIETIAHR